MKTGEFDALPADRRHHGILGNRWVIAGAGTMMMMCLGTVYSWSLFARPLIASFHWSVMTMMWTFSIAIFSLGIGAVVGGRAQDKVGPRKIALYGIMLWALGNVLAGMFTEQLGVLWLYLTYGVIGGFGLGMGYVSPVAMVTKWFPDHRGLAGGLVVTGFGLGAFFYNNIVPRLPGFAHAAAAANAFITRGHAFTPADVHAVMLTFVWSGLAYLVIGGSCALILRDPPEEYGRRAEDPIRIKGRQYRPSEALRTPQFYLLWLMLFCSVTAGILVISNAVPIFSDLTGTSAAVAAFTVGMLAIFNGIGRTLWGYISDRIGRNNAYIMILGIQAAIFALMPVLHAPVAVAVAFGLVLLCNGGSFGTMPAFNADFFGTKYMGLNYGMIITAWGCAGVVGPLLAARVKDVTGSYSGTLLPVALMLLAATILPMVARRPGETAPIVLKVRELLAARQQREDALAIIAAEDAA
ncbi:MAG TPA: OFA family MFS transporter [Candidatus Elarobacter sp.]|jgi:MFS family permease